MPLSLPISVVVPVRNEQANLPGCLESLRDVSDVTVVDSGSTDGTREVAERHGRPVVQFTWNGRYPKKRNWALERCSSRHDWVLFLDADERMTPAAANELRRVLPATPCNGFWLTYDNWFMGKLLRHGDPMRKLALVRRGCGAYERVDEDAWSGLDMEVHEHIVVQGPVGRIRARLEHHDRRDLKSYHARHEEYASWEAARYLALQREADASPLGLRQRVKYRLLPMPFFPAAYFLASYVIRGGFLDGRAGLAFALSKERYFRQVQLKIRERLRQARGASA
jgi:glycosyltransferase involved in cell wall biosynthesis